MPDLNVLEDKFNRLPPKVTAIGCTLLLAYMLPTAVEHACTAMNASESYVNRTAYAVVWGGCYTVVGLLLVKLIHWFASNSNEVREEKRAAHWKVKYQRLLDKVQELHAQTEKDGKLAYSAEMTRVICCWHKGVMVDLDMAIAPSDEYLAEQMILLESNFQYKQTKEGWSPAYDWRRKRTEEIEHVFSKMRADENQTLVDKHC